MQTGRVSSVQPQNPTVLDVEKDAVGSGVPLIVCAIFPAQHDSYMHVLECGKEGEPLKNLRTRGATKAHVIANISHVNTGHL